MPEFGEGLDSFASNFMQSYTQLRRMQDDKKNQEQTRSLNSLVHGVRIKQDGQGYEYTPEKLQEIELDRTGKLQKGKLDQDKFDLDKRYTEAQIGKLQAEAAKLSGKGKSAAVASGSEIAAQDLGRALKMTENPLASGKVMGSLKDIPIVGRLAPAKDLDNMIQSIKGNLAFDRLKKMRDESPTGGALGAVSDRELELLASSAGKLDAAMSTSDLRENLKRIQNMYMNMIYGEGQGPARHELSFDRLGNPIEKKGSAAEATLQGFGKGAAGLMGGDINEMQARYASGQEPLEGKGFLQKLTSSYDRSNRSFAPMDRNAQALYGELQGRDAQLNDEFPDEYGSASVAGTTTSGVPALVGSGASKLVPTGKLTELAIAAKTGKGLLGKAAKMLFGDVAKEGTKKVVTKSAGKLAKEGSKKATGKLAQEATVLEELVAAAKGNPKMEAAVKKGIGKLQKEGGKKSDWFMKTAKRKVSE